jgi:inosine triphosphate pyrophosphatase
MSGPTIVFITGNKGKLDEVTSILGSTVRLLSLKLDLPELQGPTAEYIVREKAKTAFREAQRHQRESANGSAADELPHSRMAVMIEDTSLSFDCLGGNLPGPYIKWFLDGVGVAGLYKMAAALGGVDGGSAVDQPAKGVCPSMRAVASCIFTIAYSEDEVELFEGTCEGCVVAPRGDMGFGWDPIFEPFEQHTDADGKRKTFAEMSCDEKNAISHRSKALAALKTHFAAASGVETCKLTKRARAE